MLVVPFVTREVATVGGASKSPNTSLGNNIRFDVENQLRWRRDVVMSEDQDHRRMGNTPHNLAMLRRMAINVVQKDPAKGSLRGKLKRAGWDAYLTLLLASF